MAKLITMFMILIALQAAMMLYANGTTSDTDLWTFVWNIDQWGSLAFIVSLGAIAAAIGLTGISSGSVFGFKTDFLVMAPAIAGLISIGVVFTNLGNMIRDELVARVFTACADPSVSCTPATYIVAIIVGPLALYYAWTVVEWWRGKDN